MVVFVGRFKSSFSWGLDGNWLVFCAVSLPSDLKKKDTKTIENPGTFPKNCPRRLILISRFHGDLVIWGGVLFFRHGGSPNHHGGFTILIIVVMVIHDWMPGGFEPSITLETSSFSDMVIPSGKHTKRANWKITIFKFGQSVNQLCLCIHVYNDVSKI